jgi:hypothetical protein
MSLGAMASADANAAVTSYSSAVLVDSGANLLNPAATPGHSLISAVNFTIASQSTPVRNPTVNGIAFTPFDIPPSGSQLASYSGTDWTLTSNSANVLIHDGNRVSGRPSTADIYPLIYNAVVSPVAVSNQSFMTLQLQNLTIGQPYRLQLVFSSDQASRGVTVTDTTASAGTSTPGTTGNISYGTTEGPKVITGLFTADATTQSVNIIATTSGTRVQFSGFTVAAVPEPASAGALGAAGAALVLRRRRANRAR